MPKGNEVQWSCACVSKCTLCLQYMVSIDLSWSYTPFNQRHVEMRRQYENSLCVSSLG